MSLQFNDTSLYNGIVQQYEKRCKMPRGFISGDTDRLKDFTVDTRMAWDEFMGLAIKAGGSWQYDDSNHTDDYPIVKTSIVSGQRDYPFVSDENGNLILDIYKVLVADSSGVYHEIFPVDQQRAQSPQFDASNFTDGRNTAGMPTCYDKTANGIIFDLVPNYNYTNGIKVFVNREASYFVYTDTTKKPGAPGILHAWWYLRPALEYAKINMSNDDYQKIFTEVEQMKVLIKETFAFRQKDVKNKLKARVENNK